MPGEIRRQLRTHEDRKLLSDKDMRQLETMTRIYRQQKNHFVSGDSRESVPDRIVSVSKLYIRSIVRGKEVKTVGFGAKCNNVQIDGISFIEKLSFNAFNEGTRLKHCLSLSKKLFSVDVKKTSGDRGYPGNDNRTFCKDNGIETSFAQKSRTGKDEVKTEVLEATEFLGVEQDEYDHYLRITHAVGLVPAMPAVISLALK